jgi:hypothetical protein
VYYQPAEVVLEHGGSSHQSDTGDFLGCIELDALTRLSIGPYNS